MTDSYPLKSSSLMGVGSDMSGGSRLFAPLFFLCSLNTGVAPKSSCSFPLVSGSLC